MAAYLQTLMTAFNRIQHIVSELREPTGGGHMAPIEEKNEKLHLDCFFTHPLIICI